MSADIVCDICNDAGLNPHTRAQLSSIHKLEPSTSAIETWEVLGAEADDTMTEQLHQKTHHQPGNSPLPGQSSSNIINPATSVTLSGLQTRSSKLYHEEA